MFSVSAADVCGAKIEIYASAWVWLRNTPSWSEPIGNSAKLWSLKEEENNNCQGHTSLLHLLQ